MPAARRVTVRLRMALSKNAGLNPDQSTTIWFGRHHGEKQQILELFARFFVEHRCQLMLMISQVRWSPVLVKVFHATWFTPLIASEEAYGRVDRFIY